ncbi:hypothetical protein N7455_003959 [Penicillium solitum]|uniref:uncharacterized protein n=1 Tax=Penicillium solitum TaxID=60172 RepID=UPI0032C491D9|nr:hypothetical protein N7455_003959 [Penicillium solitum]
MMDGINKNTKTGNQAWRKKASQVRSKVKTRLIRRVKCDLSRPSCVKCLPTGRTCDGYSEMPLPFKTDRSEIESTHYHKEMVERTDSCDSNHRCTTISAHESKRWYLKYYGLNVQNLESLMILPVTGST